MLFADAVFNVFAGVFHVTNCVQRVLGDVHQNVVVVLLLVYSIILFESCLFRSYYSCSYGVMRNLDAIIHVRMVLCETSMLLFMSVWCYAKPRCYYSGFE